MELEEKIEELKLLSVAHELALDHDYCPNDEDIMSVLVGYGHISEELLIKAIGKYKNWSYTNIESETFRKIEGL